MVPAYSHSTELRNVQSNDLYKLVVILDENDYWKRLLESIPKCINNKSFNALSDADFDIKGRKYSNDDIRLIQRQSEQPGESRLCPQILFDEWASSGRKDERPTLGVLLHLLKETHIFRAADYVAQNLIGESAPSRPNEGPGAIIDCDLPSAVLQGVSTMLESQASIDTDLLEQNVKCGTSLLDNNKDFYEKYVVYAPKPPPREKKNSRLVEQQHHQRDISQQTANGSHIHGIFEIKENENEPHPQSKDDAILANTDSLPNISLLMEPRISENEYRKESSMLANEDSTPKLSIFHGNSNSIGEASGVTHSSNRETNILTTNDFGSNVDNGHNLPAISALNLKDEQSDKSQKVMSDTDCDETSVSGVDEAACDMNFLPGAIEDINMLEEDVDYYDDIDDEADLPNLSILNDSSLTSVTNTSGDNSFEQSVNDSSRPDSADNLPAFNLPK